MLLAALSSRTAAQDLTEACRAVRAEANKQVAMLRDLEHRPPPRWVLPPHYHWECRGAPAYADRDRREDTAKQQFVEEFLEQELEVAAKLVSLARDLELGCASHELDDAMVRARTLIADRIKTSSLQARQTKGTDKFDRYTPLIAAIISAESRRLQLGYDGGDLSSTVATEGVRLLDGLIQELIRRIQIDHDLRITPAIMGRLLNDAALLSNGVAALPGRYAGLWRTKVTVNNVVRLSGRDGGLESEVELADEPMLPDLADQRRRGFPLVYPYPSDEPRKFEYRRMVLPGFSFVGPRAFRSDVLVEIDPCDAEPAVHVSISRFGPDEEVFLAKSRGRPFEMTFPSFAAGIASTVLALRAVDAMGAPGPKFKLRLRNRTVRLAHQSISATLPYSAVGAADELTITVEHAPSGVSFP